MSLVVGGLEREGVKMMRECEPREVRRVMGEGEEGRLEVVWLNKRTGKTERVSEKECCSFIRCFNMYHAVNDSLCTCACCSFL